MSIASLMDHRGVLHRPRPDSDPTTRDETGDVIPVFDVLPAPPGLNCRPNQAQSGSLQDDGPGERRVGDQTWYLLPGFDVREGDVLELLSGVQSGNRRILFPGPCTGPIGLHHWEPNTEVYHGSVHPDAVTS
jgi:hypothetical protein